MRLITFYNAYAGRCVATLAGVVAVATFLYGAFLLAAVAHATGRTAAEREVRHLVSAVSALENTYLTETRSLSPQRAAEMGFVQPSAVVTVYTGTAALTVRQ